MQLVEEPNLKIMINPINTAKLINCFLSFFRDFEIFFLSKIKAKGVTAKNPTKNLTALNVNGPISSIPVSWAIKVVPQINVQSNALNNEAVFDMKVYTANL